MADKIDLEAIGRGPATWNTYVQGRRRAKSTWRADLSGATVSRADLRGVDLAGADLRRADLTHANLTDANLRGANLSGANLSGADLLTASLRGAILIAANLSGADLGGARLMEAKLTSANMTGSNLTGANFFSADLRAADLTKARVDLANFTETTLTGAIIDVATSADIRAAVVVRLGVPLDVGEPAHVLAGIVNAVDALAELAVMVGSPRNLGGSQRGGGVRTATLTGSAEPRKLIRVWRLHYGSPFVMELVEQLPPWVAGIGAGGVVVVGKNLLFGNDSGLLVGIRHVFNLPQQIRTDRAVLRAEEAEAEEKRLAYEGRKIRLRAASQDEIADRMAQSPVDDQEKRTMAKTIDAMRPLTARELTMQAEVWVPPW